MGESCVLINCLVVGAGGFVGSVLRYLCSLIPTELAFPFATLAINIVGSFLLAFVAEIVLKGSLDNEQLSLMLRVGLCGGFTTFSTFSFESMQLMQQGEVLFALSYIVLTCALCVGAAFLGDWLAASW